MSEGGSPSVRSDGSSEPPAAQVATNTAQSLASTHPLWQRAAGNRPAQPPTQRGRGGTGSKDGGGAKYEPLSAMMLEYGGFRANADGDSALFSEDGDRSIDKPPRPSKRRATEEDDDGEDYGGFSALAGSEDDSDDEEDRRKKKKKKSGERGAAPANADAAMYASAAFGGAYGGASDAESVSNVSGTSSSRRKAAYKAAFPIKGIDCVGCMLTKQIAPVERFVKDHFEKMAEDALWKQAALVYVREVQEPRKREGVLTPAVRARDFEPSHTHTHTLTDRPCFVVAVVMEGPAISLLASLLGPYDFAHVCVPAAADHALRRGAAADARGRQRARAGQELVRSDAQGAHASPHTNPSRPLGNLPPVGLIALADYQGGERSALHSPGHVGQEGRRTVNGRRR